MIESASSDEASEESEDDSLTPQGYDPLPGEQVQILHCKKGHWYGLVVGRGEDTSFAKNSPKEAAINIQVSVRSWLSVLFVSHAFDLCSG